MTREQINEAKRRLPLPSLMKALGLGERAEKNARCPFHDDQHPSFSIFQGNNGDWFWKCHAGCGEGDEIAFLAKREGASFIEAATFYCEMSGVIGETPKPKQGLTGSVQSANGGKRGNIVQQKGPKDS